MRERRARPMESADAAGLLVLLLLSTLDSLQQLLSSPGRRCQMVLLGRLLQTLQVLALKAHDQESVLRHRPPRLLYLM